MVIVSVREILIKSDSKIISAIYNLLSCSTASLANYKASLISNEFIDCWLSSMETIKPVTLYVYVSVAAKLGLKRRYFWKRFYKF